MKTTSVTIFWQNNYAVSEVDKRKISSNNKTQSQIAFEK